MYFENIPAAVSMGGHGGFVWSAYGICVLVLVTILLAPRRRQQRLLRRLAGEQKRQQQGPTVVKEVN